MKIQGLYCETVELEDTDSVAIGPRNYLYIRDNGIYYKSVNPVDPLNITREVVVSSAGIASNWDDEERKLEWRYYKDALQK